MWPMASLPGSSARTSVGEDIGHVAHGFVAVDFAAVAGADAGAFLAAMLQRVEAQVGHLGGLGMAVNGEDAAFFVEFVKHSL